MDEPVEFDDGVGPQPQQSDAILLGRVTRGDRVAFEELYDRFVARVHGLVRAIVEDADRAEEIVVTLFVDLWRSPSDLLSRPGAVPVGIEASILATAHRRAVQSAREHRQEAAVVASPVQPIPRPAARVLDRIPDADAVTAMGLAYFGARTTSEIAARMDVPLARAVSLLRRGLQDLRRGTGAS